MPVGGSAILRATRVRDQDGILKLQVNVDGGLVQTWPNWLAIAFDRLQEAFGARERLLRASASGESEAEANAVVAEYQAGLQAISSAVFALDALYGVIAHMIIIPKVEVEARKLKDEGRAVAVADAILRASARMPNEARKLVAKNIHSVYKARDLAVHPAYVQEPFTFHPQLDGTKVPQRWIDYNFEASMEVVRCVVGAMTWAIDHPQPLNPALVAWAKIATTMLHRIIDPFVNADPSSPLALERPA
jgi:hypothetical protein